MIRFVLTIEAEEGQVGIDALRWLLKRLGNRGLRCIDAYEDRSSCLEISNQVADEFQELRAAILEERVQKKWSSRG
jgi:hypothetical protein